MGGLSENPMSLHRWSYGFYNPIRYTDATGHSPLLCGIPYIDCLDTAGNIVIAAKMAYSQVGPITLAYINKGFSRFNCFNQGWSKPERAIDLLADYFCERGPENVKFYGSDTLTQELARSSALHLVRSEFYLRGEIRIPKEYRFNTFQVGLATLFDPDIAYLTGGSKFLS